VLGGLAAAAAGLVGAMVIKMGQPLRREGAPALIMAALAFLAIGILRYPLRYVLLVLVPISILLAAWVRR
jgi:chromate transporter